MLTVLLVRHASHGLLDRVLCGRGPGIALSAAGRAEAERLAALLSGRGIARILSSPVERARETAAALGAGLALPVEIAAEIDEVDCGAWTGASFDSLAEDPDWRRWNAERSTFRIPGGETMTAVQARAMALVERLARDGADRDAAVALVTHSDVIKAVVMAVLGLSLDRHDHLAIDPASVTTLQVWSDYARVVRVNEVAGP